MQVVLDDPAREDLQAQSCSAPVTTTSIEGPTDQRPAVRIGIPAAGEALALRLASSLADAALVVVL